MSLSWCSFRRRKHVRNGLLLGSALFLVLHPLRATPPAWWTESNTRIIEEGTIPDIEANYAPANLGQIKHIASQAKKHLDSHLPGGAGSAVNSLVESFGVSPNFEQREANYSPANLGQLKAISKPFYDRLMSFQYNTQAGLIAGGYPAGWPHHYPWNPGTPVADNYQPANLGQLKAVFNFDLTAITGQLPEWWQLYYFGQTGISPTDDYDNDGFNNLLEYESKTNPMNYYSRPGGNLNLPPEVTLNGENVLLPGQTSLPLEAIALDPDGGPSAMTYTWSSVSGPASVTFSQPNQPETNAQFSATGTYVLKIEVSDGASTSAALTVVNVLNSTTSLPNISFSAPESGSQLDQNQEFAIWIEANDPNYPIDTVELYRNGTLLESRSGNGSNSHYLFNRIETSLGAVTFTAIAKNQVGVSSAASITLSFYPTGVGPPPAQPNPGNPGSAPVIPGSMKTIPLSETGPWGFPMEHVVFTSGEDKVSEETEYTGEPGQTVLVEVVIYSFEYPEYTGYSSEYDDIVSWTVSPSWGGSKSGTNRVNALHNKFDVSHDGGAMVGAYVVKFPNDPDPAKRKLKFKGVVQNIADGIYDTWVEFRLVPVEIKEVSFDGSKYWKLKSDDAATTYEAPQWKDVDGNGVPTNTAQGEHDYAVAFTRNSKPKISAKFNITNASNLGTIKIKAIGPSGLAIPETAATVSGDDVTLPLTEASTELANTIKFYDKTNDSKAFRLEWQLKIGNSDWSIIGMTKHTVYLTLADPTE